MVNCLYLDQLPSTDRQKPKCPRETAVQYAQTFFTSRGDGLQYVTSNEGDITLEPQSAEWLQVQDAMATC